MTASRRDTSALLAAAPAFARSAPLGLAAACGLLSAVGLRWQWETLGRLLLVVLLAEFVYRWTAGAVAQLPQTQARARRAAAALLPYAQPGSPAEQMFRWRFGLAASWRQLWGLPQGVWMRLAVLLAATGLLLAYGLGAPGVWVAVAGLALAVALGAWSRHRPDVAYIWSPLALTATAWVLGNVSAGEAASWRLAVAPLFGLAATGLAAFARGYGWGKPAFWFGLTSPSVLLAAEHLALSAVVVLFVSIPAYMLGPGAEDNSETYLRRVQPLLWLSMLIAGLSLGWA